MNTSVITPPNTEALYPFELTHHPEAGQGIILGLFDKLKSQHYFDKANDVRSLLTSIAGVECNNNGVKTIYSELVATLTTIGLNGVANLKVVGRSSFKSDWPITVSFNFFITPKKVYWEAPFVGIKDIQDVTNEVVLMEALKGLFNRFRGEGKDYFNSYSVIQAYPYRFHWIYHTQTFDSTLNVRNAERLKLETLVRGISRTFTKPFIKLCGTDPFFYRSVFLDVFEENTYPWDWVAVFDVTREGKVIRITLGQNDNPRQRFFDVYYPERDVTFKFSSVLSAADLHRCLRRVFFLLSQPNNPLKHLKE